MEGTRPRRGWGGSRLCRRLPNGSNLHTKRARAIEPGARLEESDGGNDS